MRDVFPAHAGLNRVHAYTVDGFDCVPRTRGAEPEFAEDLALDLMCSPHTRG